MTTTAAGQEAEASLVRPAAAAGDDPFGFSPWLRHMASVAVPPLMGHPVAAFAAVSAIGLGMASHLVGTAMGAMQGVAAQAKAALDQAAKAEIAARTVDGPEPAVVVRQVKRPARRVGRTTARAGKTLGKNAARADDLKAISGIGPKLEQALNGRGIFRFADIARWSASEVERIEAEFGLDGRIARDGWVEQAGRLARNRD